MPHIHELFDFTASAYIVHPDLDQVLLVHHKKLGEWLQIGGHVELNEDPDQALAHEIQEECGLEVTIISHKEGPTQSGTKVLYRPDFMQVHNFNATHRHIDMGYVALAKSDEFKLAPEEHNTIRWFSRDEFTNPEVVRPAVAWYCAKALDLAIAYRKVNLEKFKKTLQ
jgi:8-oxo-dGTP diphosphatase